MMHEYLDFALNYIFEMGYRFDWKELILGLATPIFITALFLEMYVLRERKDIFKLKEVLCNFGLGFSYQAVEVVLHFLFLGAFMHWLSSYRFYDVEINAFTLVIGFLGMEFLYYWYHRANHRIRYLWCSHVVHHSSEGMNMSTATRQSMTYAISGGLIFFFSPLIFIGYPPEIVMSMYAVDLFYQYFIHTQSVKKLHPWFEFFFNTPSHHRAHHGRNKEYIDMNYGGVVIIYDRLFGTFIEEDMENNPVDYGIPRQIYTYNIFKINFHEWIDMFKDMFKPGSVGQRLKHLWAPPEWVREEVGGEEGSADKKA
jgi:sterol desaturase/sphingolipid hydroxylase (fatty acid hydroxylase superfamily)